MRIEHPVRDCIVHKIGATAKFQFGVDSFPICLDGSFTDAEFPCNRLCSKTSSYSSQNLSLTSTEPLRLRLAKCIRFPAEQDVGNRIAQPRIKVSPTAMNGPNRFIELQMVG